jgi:hypothetical protein
MLTSLYGYEPPKLKNFLQFSVVLVVKDYFEESQKIIQIWKENLANVYNHMKQGAKSVGKCI